MKMNLFFPLFFLSVCTSVFAAEDKAKPTSFEQIKPHRESFQDQFIQIEGRIKNLKTIKEGGNQFATFFLTEADNPESTISIKVNLAKKRTVINTFTCKEGEFTSVQGRFKPWGSASYLGKIEIRESHEFKCSQVAQTRKAPAVESDVLKATILKVSSNGSVTVKGKKIKKSGAKLDPGTIIKTGANAFVQLKYPDGSKITVGSNSELSTQKGTKSLQSLSLNHGIINALIHKNPSEEIHFKVKTKSATMGVRGTQFFVEATKTDKTTIHVIEGRVDVAKDDEVLASEKAAHVSHDEYIEVESGKISQVKHFEVSAYLEKLKTDQPELFALAGHVSREKEVTVVSAATPASTPVMTPVASPTPTVSHKEKSEWAVFRFAALGYLSKNNKATFTGIISWNPEIHLIARWKLGLDLGYTSVKLPSLTRTNVLESALVGSFLFNPVLSAEIKVGAQTWFSSPSVTGAMGGLTLKFGLSERRVINHIILGDDIFSRRGEIFNIARLGIGVAL